MATAFGVRRLGAALIVNSNNEALTGKKGTPHPLSAEICRVKEDYQSGAKPPHSKNSVILRTFFKLTQKMEPHKRQYLLDELARGLAVMVDVKRVRSFWVIDERNGQIARQRLAQETVHRFVQMRHFVQTRSCDE